MTSDGQNELRLKPLQDLIVGGWNATAEEHRAALADGWPIAEEFVRLHWHALWAISRAAGIRPSESDKTIILLGCHGLNLYLATLGLSIRGLFDVWSYLMRGLLDCQSLLYATAKDGRLAEQFRVGKLKASDARKLIIDDLRNGGEKQLAKAIEELYKDASEAANQLAHVKMYHGYKVVELQNDLITPVAGGRVDTKECISCFKLATAQESHALGWFEAFRRPALSNTWVSNFGKARQGFSTWMKT